MGKRGKKGRRMKEEGGSRKERANGL